MLILILTEKHIWEHTYAHTHGKWKTNDFIQIWCKPGSRFQYKLMKSKCASPECMSSLHPFLPRWQLICELKNSWYQLESYFPYYVNSDGGKVTFFAIACSNFTGSTLASGMTMVLFRIVNYDWSQVPHTRSAGPHCLLRQPLRSSGPPVLSLRSNMRRNHQIITSLTPHL